MAELILIIDTSAIPDGSPRQKTRKHDGCKGAGIMIYEKAPFRIGGNGPRMGFEVFGYNCSCGYQALLSEVQEAADLEIKSAKAKMKQLTTGNRQVVYSS